MTPVFNEIAGKEETIKGKPFWIFEEKGLERKCNDEATSGLNKSSSISSASGSVSSISSVQEMTQMSDEEDFFGRMSKFETSSGYVKYSCNMCNFATVKVSECRIHLDEQHENWMSESEVVSKVRKNVIADSISLNATMDDDLLNEDVGKSADVVASQTVHTKPDWRENLTKNFMTLIISKCSLRTREAVESNENIQDSKLRKATENEIINTTISHLETVFGGVCAPRLSDCREIALKLTHVYPGMFNVVGSSNEELVSYGKKLSYSSLDDIAHKISHRVMPL